jgi:hypothetical protein
MSPHAETEEPMLGNGAFRVAANAFALADLTWIVLLVLRRRKGSRSGLTNLSFFEFERERTHPVINRRDARLASHRDSDPLLAISDANQKIGWSRPVGRHRRPVDSGFGQGAHRHGFHRAVRHLRDEHDLGDRHRLARRGRQPHGVRIAPA